MSSNHHHWAQSGFVAIFTVVFFIILTSVLTLGFVRIMLDERRQSTDNDLAASALHAAETGIEDGKRLLVFCEQNPAEPACLPALSQTTCPGAFSDNGIANLLGVNLEDDGSVRVASTEGHEQHYTCLLVKRTTDDYLGNLPANQSDMIPLRAAGQFDTIELSWHLIAQDGAPVGYPAVGSLHDTEEWTAGQYPAYMRLQYIEHANGAIDLTALDNSSRHVFLAPASDATAKTSVDLNVADPRPAGNSTPGARAKDQAVPVQCVPASTTAQPYACTIRVRLGTDADPESTTSYLRLVPIYGATNFRVKLFDNSTLVRLDGAQPLIDATGRSNDVFRRVQTRVRLDGSAFYPQFALESGKDLCKDMVVTSDLASFADNCNPVSPPPAPAGCTASIPITFPVNKNYSEPQHLYDNDPLADYNQSYSVSPPALAGIKAGCRYRVNLQAADASHPHDPLGSVEQDHEQVAAYFYKNGVELPFYTGLTADFPDAQMYSPILKQDICFTSPVDTITFKHHYLVTGIRSYSSVQPSSITLDYKGTC